MRVAVTSQGDDLEAQVDPRFGRAPKFLLIDTNSMSFEVIDNSQNLNLPQGAGIQTAQNIVQQNPEVVLTGNCGPKAFKALQATGVEVVVGVEGKIKAAVQAFLNGDYQVAKEASVSDHYGMGQGMGMGGGRGKGMGRGRGMGRSKGGGRGMGRGR